jgi:hypothetical protein
MFRIGDPVRLTVAALAARQLSPTPINRARGLVVAVGADEQGRPTVTAEWGSDVRETASPETFELALRNHFDSKPPAATEAA